MRSSYPRTIGSLLKQTIYRKGTGEMVYGKTRCTWPKGSFAPLVDWLDSKF